MTHRLHRVLDRIGLGPPDYGTPEAFLRPRLRPWSGHLYLHRKPLLDAVRAASAVLGGKLLDLGCGRKPYAGVLKTERHFGLDVQSSPHWCVDIDVAYDGRALPIRDGAVDSVLCTEVLEHSTEPGDVVREIARVLRPGGHALLTAPMVIENHEVPHDFHRFTRHGLQRLATGCGLEMLWIRPRGGVCSTLAVTLYVLLGWSGVRRPLADVCHVVLWAVTALAVLVAARSNQAEPPLSLGWQMLVRKPICGTAYDPPTFHGKRSP